LHNPAFLFNHADIESPGKFTDISQIYWVILDPNTFATRFRTSISIIIIGNNPKQYLLMSLWDLALEQEEYGMAIPFLGYSSVHLSPLLKTKTKSPAF